MKIGLLPICLAATVVAQNIIPRPPHPPIIIPPLPPIVVKIPIVDNTQPVLVEAADIVADIDGVLAETTITLKLYNPNDRVLEGELLFPLPVNATVSGYALDINGAMVDGVIVEKEKARVVFDEVTRQGIDPGLAEQVGGNMFRTRVYPLNPKGHRTVMVRYVSTTLNIKENGEIASYYVLPLNFPDKLESFKLKMNVAAAIKPPEVKAGALSGFTFTNWKTIYTANTELKDIALTEDMYVSVMTRPDESFLHQKASDGQRYFTWNLLADSDSKAVPRSDKPVVLWDASMSRDKSDHSQEIEFVKKAFAKASELTLIVFRNVPEAPIVFDSAEKLAAALQAICYDGATSLKGALAAIPSGAEAYVFTDGLDNLSPEDIPASKASRIFMLTGDKQQNAAALKRLAAGGATIDLRTVAIDDALALLDSANPSVTAVTCDGKAIDFVSQFDSGRLAVAGILPEKASEIVMQINNAGKVSTKKAAIVKDNSLDDGRLLRINYGQLKINDLLATGAEDAKVTAAGKEFGLVTPNTSLMVLDTLQQYLRYNIRPPESLPKMREQYDAANKGKKDEKWGESFALEKNSPEHVKALWSDLVKWYKKDYPRVAKNVQSDTEAVAAGGERRGIVGRVLNAIAPSRARAVEDGAVMMEAAPAPAGAVAPMAEEAAREPAAAKSTSGQAPAASAPKMVLKPWTPDTPYIKALKSAGKKAYEEYLKQRESYGEAAGFYMDCADFFHEAGDKAIALRVLSNLAEMELENKQVMRILGYKLRFWGELKTAEIAFRNVIGIAREEPQTYRDLALVLDDMERFQEAVDMMMNVVNYKFDNRFPEIETIALTEINRMISRAKRKGIEIKGVDKDYICPIETDIRAVINWDTDMSDMDIWVTDPFKEKCFYGHRFTVTGGRNSCDFTQGYGPEAFMIRDAVKGKYLVQTDYYGTHTQKVIGPVTLYAEIYTNYGRENEERQFLAFRLDSRKQVIDVATIDHDGINRAGVHSEPFDYQVKKGDTLQSIAEQFYKDASYVDEILKLNPNIKKDGNVRVGMIIKLPATRK